MNKAEPQTAETVMAASAGPAPKAGFMAPIMKLGFFWLQGDSCRCYHPSAALRPDLRRTHHTHERISDLRPRECDCRYLPGNLRGGIFRTWIRAWRHAAGRSCRAKGAARSLSEAR